MSSWRIREIENQIRDLESKQMNCSSHDDEWHDLERKISDLKDELRRLKRREEEEEKEEDERHRNSAFSIGLGSFGRSHSGGFSGFGGGRFGGGGSGGSW